MRENRETEETDGFRKREKEIERGIEIKIKTQRGANIDIL